MVTLRLFVLTPLAVLLAINALLVDTVWRVADQARDGQALACIESAWTVHEAMAGGFAAMEGAVDDILAPAVATPDPVAAMRQTNGLFRAVHVYVNNTYVAGCIDVGLLDGTTDFHLRRLENDTSLRECQLLDDGRCQAYPLDLPVGRTFPPPLLTDLSAMPGGHVGAWVDAARTDLIYDATVQRVVSATGRLFAFYAARPDGVQVLAVGDDLRLLDDVLRGLPSAVIATAETISGLGIAASEAAVLSAARADAGPVVLFSAATLVRCGGRGDVRYPLTAYYVQEQRQPHYSAARSEAETLTISAGTVGVALFLMFVLFLELFRRNVAAVTASCDESVSFKEVQDVTLYVEYPKTCLLEFVEPLTAWEALGELAYRLNQYKCFIPQMLLDSLHESDADTASSPLSPHSSDLQHGGGSPRSSPSRGRRFSSRSADATEMSEKRRRKSNDRDALGSPVVRVSRPSTSGGAARPLSVGRRRSSRQGPDSPPLNASGRRSLHGRPLSGGSVGKDAEMRYEINVQGTEDEKEGVDAGALRRVSLLKSPDQESPRQVMPDERGNGGKVWPGRSGLRVTLRGEKPPPSPSKGPRPPRSARRDPNDVAASLRIRKATVLYIGVDILNANTVFVEQHTTLSNNLVRTVFDVAKHYEGVVLNLGPNCASMTWNCHKAIPQHCLQGCQAALDLSAQLDSLFGTRFSWSFGLASGNAFVGQTGGAEQKTVMVAGEPMYLSKKLSTLCLKLNAKMLVNEVIFDQVSTQMYLKLVDSVPLPVETVRTRLREPDWDVESYDTGSHTSEEDGAVFAGISPQTTLVYQLISVRGGQEERDEMNPELYIEGFSCLRRNKFKQSAEKFREYLDTNPTCYQAFRLGKLASTLYANKGDQRPPAPYYRRDLGFDSMEQRAIECGIPIKGVQPVAAPFIALLQLDEWVSVLSKTLMETPNAMSPVSKSMRRGQLAALAVTGRSAIDLLAKFGSNTPPMDPQSPAVPRMGTDSSKADSKVSRSGSGTSFPTTPEPVVEAETRNWHAAGIALQPRDPQEPPIEIRNPARGERWWRSRKRVGAGDFGEVWKAMSDDGGMVVLKTLRIPDNTPAIAVDEIVLEVSLLSQLRHDNLTSYLSSCVAGEYVVIVLEYMSGGSLGGLLDQFSIVPLSSTVRYLKDILRGLQFLHKQDITHCDIKPHNVLLLVDGQCKLSDYASAQYLQKLLPTAKKAGGGTPLYMAPEACRGNFVKASDIWSVGILTVRMITGALPYTFTDDDPLDDERFMQRLATDPAYRPVIKTDGLSRYTQTFIESCLLEEPNDRANCEDLLLTSMLNVTHDSTASLPEPRQQ